MLGRFALVSVVLAALGVPTAIAGPVNVPFWLLKKQCEESSGTVKLCAHQFATGSRNWAVTKQKTELGYPTSSTVFSVTVQNGNDNAAYTGQYGTDLTAKTIQNGDGNKSGIFQEGDDLKTTIVQNGDGIWSASSSEGDGATVKIVSNSY
jgi:hypothetical protein